MNQIQATSIILNDAESGMHSAMYFLNKGHKNFAIFYQKGYFPKIERMRGMKEYLERSEKEVSITLFPFIGQGAHSTAIEVAKNLISSYNGEHLAVFASSDEDAHVIIQKAKEAHLSIGEDISIIGFDNFESLDITTFTHPSIHMGKIAAREMLDLIDNNNDIEAITITLQANFVERSSVKNLIHSTKEDV
jgi:LacI family transcriptional regulator